MVVAHYPARIPPRSTVRLPASAVGQVHREGGLTRRALAQLPYAIGSLSLCSSPWRPWVRARQALRRWHHVVRRSWGSRLAQVCSPPLKPSTRRKHPIVTSGVMIDPMVENAAEKIGWARRGSKAKAHTPPPFHEQRQLHRLHVREWRRERQAYGPSILATRRLWRRLHPGHWSWTPREHPPAVADAGLGHPGAEGEIVAEKMQRNTSGGH